MQLNLFIKYVDLRLGLRMVIDEHAFYFEYDALPQQGDEIFAAHFNSSKKTRGLLELQKRISNVWFIYILQELFSYQTRRIKNSQRAARKKKIAQMNTSVIEMAVKRNFNDELELDSGK